MLKGNMYLWSIELALDSHISDEELNQLFKDLVKDPCVLEVKDLSNNELAKAHVRYLIGGRVEVYIFLYLGLKWAII